MTDADTSLPPPPFEDPAVVFKPWRTHGGLELYAAELARTTGAPIYTAEDRRPDRSVAADTEVVEFGESGIVQRGLRRLPIGAVRERFAYENFPVPEEHDLVITIGEVAKSVVHRPDQRRIHVLNMPPRWLFDQGPGRFGQVRKRAYQSLVRIHDISTVPRINDFVVPSEVIARRLQTYYGREPAAIIYPPVDTARYYHDETEGFLLVLGRLAADKRVGEIVDALSGTEYRLKIAGSGPERDGLEAQASGNVEFLGFVSEERKRELLATCDALLFNADREAFGIVPVEALASGKPVVGVDEGFTSFQITDGENGILYERGADALVTAIERMYATDWDAEALQRAAESYDVERFRTEWRALLTGDEAA